MHVKVTMMLVNAFPMRLNLAPPLLRDSNREASRFCRKAVAVDTFRQ